MDGLSKIANYESKLETVASLRDFSEKNIQRIDSTVSTLDESRTAKELSLTEHVQAVDDFSVQLRKDYQKWQDNLYFARTFDKSGKQSEDDALMQIFKDYIGDIYDANKFGRPSPVDQTS